MYTVLSRNKQLQVTPAILNHLLLKFSVRLLQLRNFAVSQIDYDFVTFNLSSQGRHVGRQRLRLCLFVTSNKRRLRRHRHRLSSWLNCCFALGLRSLAPCLLLNSIHIKAPATDRCPLPPPSHNADQTLLTMQYQKWRSTEFRFRFNVTRFNAVSL